MQTHPESPRIVNMHAAKTQLSRLVEDVIAGAEVIIARDGVPVARLVPVEPAERTPGRWRGLALDEAFFEPLPDEVLKGFLG